jgi:dipeptidyl aminopeptidase/acylaminoacyl peptidase
MVTTRRKIAAEDLLRLKLVSDPQLSPDGSTIVFLVKVIDADKNKYFSHLWIIPTDGASLERQFTFGEVRDASPRWSPDGKQLIFFRTKDRQTQVWIMPVDGGEARPLTHLEEGQLQHLSWSPDGARILFAFSRTPEAWTQKANEEREKSGRSQPARVITRLQFRLDGVGFLGDWTHVWVADATTGAAKQVTHGDYDHTSPCWSPDGQSIAFIANRSDQPEEKPYEEDVWIVSHAGGDLRKVPTPPGYKGGLAWSRDGTFLAYSGAETQEDPWTPKNSGVWIVAANGQSAAQNVTASLDRTVGNVSLSDTREAFPGAAAPIWSVDGQHLFFIASDAGAAHLYTASVDEKKVQQLTQGTIDVTSVSADQLVTTFALAQGHALNPGEVYLWTNQQQRQLTHLNEALFDEIHLVEPEEVWYPSGALQIQGWILKPPDFEATRHYPLLLFVHGGPHAQYGHCFFHQFQLHAAQGYVVFYINPRGSMGREEAFAASIRGDWGNLDFQDVMAAADFAATLPYVDPQRMSISGGSYGGYMTNWVVGHTDRFACAITDRSVVNLHSMAGTCDFVFQPDGYWSGNVWDRPETLLAQSPLTYMAQCTTPLLIIHSEGDLRCPISEADQLYAALKRLKKEVVYIRYGAETSHGFSRSGPPDLRLDRLSRYTEWFARYLQG